jgi:hypothetical protein
LGSTGVDFFSAANPGRATIKLISKNNCCMPEVYRKEAPARYLNSQKALMKKG